jgi:hypothetical protein
MMQRPEQKCNAAIVLSGTQGIGKDAALKVVRCALGSWNSKGIEPDELFSQYRPWLETLMLVVDEVRPTKDEFHASSMYNILKPMIAAPPDTLPLNDKYSKLRYVINVLRVFITTNDWMAMYIPPEDRRMFIMHSMLQQKWHEADGDEQYFVRLFTWIDANEGESAGRDLGAWLRARDTSAFNAKGQVAKTLGWDAVSNSWGEAEDAVQGALDALGMPDVLFGGELLRDQFDGRDEIAGMLKSPRKLSHRLQKAGYLLVKPPGGSDRWHFTAEGGGIYRSRMGFVRQALLRDPVKAHIALRERGEALAAANRPVQTTGTVKEFKRF